MTKKKFVDVDKVLQDKAPGLKKWFPKFAITWLKNKLHEEEINEIMLELKDLYGLEFNAKGLEKFGANIVSVNPENVPKTGAIIVAANHPLGG